MKKYSNTNELRQSIVDGINILADNVAATLGPKGQNVIIQPEGKLPFVTKDGVTVAKFVNLEDPFQNAAVEILKQASLQTNFEAGDGTTTSTVIARAIVNEAQKYIVSGVSPIELKRGMDRTCDALVDNLIESARPIRSLEDIQHIAKISANNDKMIGDIVARAVDLAGKDGTVIIEEARSNKTSLNLIEGFKIDSGFAAGAFVTDERRGICYYDNPLILVTDERLESVDEMLPLLEQVARDGRPLVVVAEEIVDQALAALIMNAIRGTMRIVGIKAPRYGEERKSILKDLAVSVGATYISRESGVLMRDVKIEHLGTCKSLEAGTSSTTFVGGKGEGEAVEKRIEAVKALLKQSDSSHEQKIYSERITRLASGVSVIRVGGATQVEMTEAKHRVEDALEAIRSAQKDGITTGGGTALLRARAGLEDILDDGEFENPDQRLGAEILLRACESPFRQLCRNAGVPEDVTLMRVEASEYEAAGYDFRNLAECNMYESGIIDPVKVTKTALINAVSVASTLLNTNHAIIQLEG